MRHHIFTIICCILAAAASLAAKASPLTAQADSAYLKQDYKEAVRLYQQAIENEGVSPRLWYDLGNAWYRCDNLGRAMLCYQRALNIDPSMKEARLNLNFVKTRITDRPEDDTTFLTNIDRSVMRWMHPNTWAWLALLLFVCLLGSAALYIFADNVRLRKAGFFGGFIILILTVYASTQAWSSARMLRSSHLAVVTVPSARLQAEPGDAGQKGHAPVMLSEGNIVEVTDSMTVPGENVSPKWYNVRINNATKAWIRASEVEQI